MSDTIKATYDGVTDAGLLKRYEIAERSRNKAWSEFTDAERDLASLGGCDMTTSDAKGEVESTILTCVNGHPLWLSVDKTASVIYYEQAEDCVMTIFRSKHSRDSETEVSVLCDHACKVSRDNYREMERMQRHV